MDRVQTNYEKQIDKLIPMAMRSADKRLRRSGKSPNERREGVDGSKFNWYRWNEYYHQAMNDLAHEAGLRGWK